MLFPSVFIPTESSVFLQLFNTWIPGQVCQLGHVKIWTHVDTLQFCSWKSCSGRRPRIQIRYELLLQENWTTSFIIANHMKIEIIIRKLHKQKRVANDGTLFNCIVPSRRSLYDLSLVILKPWFIFFNRLQSHRAGKRYQALTSKKTVHSLVGVRCHPKKK
jgi:hypothetical protein